MRSCAAADGGVLAFDPGLNNIGSATDTGAHSDRFSGAVFGAGTAFHTPVDIKNSSFLAVDRKNPVGAYDFTHAATHAGLIIQSQGCHTGKVSEIFHLQILNSINQYQFLSKTTKARSTQRITLKFFFVLL
jgi:hypothetical protein